MIEAYYWHLELLQDLSWLKRHRCYQRSSEKLLVLFERRLIMVMFQLRVLMEHNKLNDSIDSVNLKVIRYECLVADRPFYLYDSKFPDEIFDMDHPIEATLSLKKLANQFIHHYWISTHATNKKWQFVLLFSDKERDKYAYKIDIENLLNFISYCCSEAFEVATIHGHKKEKEYKLMFS